MMRRFGRSRQVIFSILSNNLVSGDNLFYHLALDVGKAEIPALEPESESFMVETQQMQQCGLKIVDLNLILRDPETQVVRFSKNETLFYSGPGQENGETIGIMVAAQDFASGSPAFTEGGPPKFPAPDHQGVIEQAALAKVA